MLHVQDPGRHLLSWFPLLKRCIGLSSSPETVGFLLLTHKSVTTIHHSRKGTGIVILSPTRELALQIFGVAKELMAHHSQTFGIVIGGANRRAEAEKLVKGVNLVVATPGRLLDHLEVKKFIRFQDSLLIYCPRTRKDLFSGISRPS